MELSEELMEITISKTGVKLDALQEAKFKQACLQVFIDNPGIDIEDGLIASTIYLRLIVRFPDLELPLQQL
jgi:hypothetical protein